MKKVMLLIFSCAFLINAEAQNVQTDDLEKLTGDWSGQLTYLDYTSNGSETIKTSLSVEMKNPSLFLFRYGFPGETGRGGTEKFRISKDGKQINKMKVLERLQTSDGNFKIVLEEAGKDGNQRRPAVFHHILEKSGDKLTITKMVKFKDEAEYFQRNQFVYYR